MTNFNNIQIQLVVEESISIRKPNGQEIVASRPIASFEPKLVTPDNPDMESFKRNYGSFLEGFIRARTTQYPGVDIISRWEYSDNHLEVRYANHFDGDIKVELTYTAQIQPFDVEFGMELCNSSYLFDNVRKMCRIKQTKYELQTLMEYGLIDKDEKDYDVAASYFSK